MAAAICRASHCGYFANFNMHRSKVPNIWLASETLPKQKIFGAKKQGLAKCSFVFDFTLKDRENSQLFPSYHLHSADFSISFSPSKFLPAPCSTMQSATLCTHPSSARCPQSGCMQFCISIQTLIFSYPSFFISRGFGWEHAVSGLLWHKSVQIYGSKRRNHNMSQAKVLSCSPPYHPHSKWAKSLMQTNKKGISHLEIN